MVILGPLWLLFEGIVEHDKAVFWQLFLQSLAESQGGNQKTLVEVGGLRESLLGRKVAIGIRSLAAGGEQVALPSFFQPLAHSVLE